MFGSAQPLPHHLISVPLSTSYLDKTRVFINWQPVDVVALPTELDAQKAWQLLQGCSTVLVVVFRLPVADSDAQGLLEAR